MPKKISAEAIELRLNTLESNIENSTKHQESTIHYLCMYITCFINGFLAQQKMYSEKAELQEALSKLPRRIS